VRESVCLTREQVRELPSASIRIIGMPKFTHKRDVLRKVRESDVRGERGIACGGKGGMRTENVLLTPDGQNIRVVSDSLSRMSKRFTAWLFMFSADCCAQVAEVYDRSKVVDVLPILHSLLLQNYRAEWAVTFGTVGDAMSFLTKLNAVEKWSRETDPRLFGRPMYPDAVQAARMVASPFAEGKSYLILRSLPEDEDRFRNLKARLTQSCKYRVAFGALEPPAEGTGAGQAVALEMPSEADCLQMVATLDGQRLVSRNVVVPDMRRVRPLKAAHLLF
jgi:hypothetical protein